MLRTKAAFERLMREKFPDIPVISAYAYPWRLENETNSGEKIVIEVYDGTSTSGGNVTGLKNAARGVWTETFAFLVTYDKPVNSQKKGDIDLAAVTAEEIFPMFRRHELVGVPAQYVSTDRLRPHVRGLVNGMGLFRVAFVVTYRIDTTEARA